MQPHFSVRVASHRRRHMSAMMVMGAQLALLLVQLASNRSLIGPAWHVPQRPSNSVRRSMAGDAGCRSQSIATANRRRSRSAWLICAQVMMPCNVAGLCPDAPFGFNTKAPVPLRKAAPRRLPHSSTEAAALAASKAALPVAAVLDLPATPGRRSSGLLSAEEERLRWLEARLSKLDAMHAKVIADESRLQQQVKELAEFRSVGDNVL